MEKKLFTKLKWYPVKLLIITRVFSTSVYNIDRSTAYNVVFVVSSYALVCWLLVYPFFMVRQTQKHLQVIRDSDMEYSGYFELVFEVKQIHTQVFVSMPFLAAADEILLFLFIVAWGFVSCWWSSKIMEIVLSRAQEKKLLNEQEVQFYNKCRYIFVLDWLALKQLEHKLLIRSDVKDETICINHDRETAWEGVGDIRKKLFTKLKWYPFKLLLFIEVFLFSMRHYNDRPVYDTVFLVSFHCILFLLLVYPIFMKRQTKKHLQKIRSSNMKYSDYFELGLRVKRLHTIAFVIMFPIAVLYGMMLFTAFVTLFILIGYCVSYRWSSKIVKIGLYKAHKQNLLSERQLKLYILCQYICVWDWLSLKYLEYKLLLKHPALWMVWLDKHVGGDK